ncbi:MAG TPA: hypothetical protein PLV87_10585, partial [Opitutaceae bacterium]|nr:hypothetical protein [Opitutaceae bacterium]
YIVDEPMPTIEEAIPDPSRRSARKQEARGQPLALVNGWLVSGGKLLSGQTLGGAWWLGRLEPTRAAEFG